MGQPSRAASNALIYYSYAAFLVFGLFIAWRLRGQSAGEWLSANRTQKGIHETAPIKFASKPLLEWSC
ncbi:hypothetical protein AC579_8070 [Pseudocercospora musae]|uniref:Uncharacterized protein n=1 Tax=Pseudocercospora musae TaxID=113226 RepID=A0A139H5B5_9PEZI|nr:hypothetical protein AC579_8070 [Pseudocercospora musae]